VADPSEPYPARWEADVVTRDGGTVHVRPIRPADRPRIAELHGRLSPETVYFRFFAPLPTLPDALLDRFVNVDYVDRLALVALLGDRIIAVARYERLPTGTETGDEAEVAFLVDDAHQGRGLGAVLLEHLAAAARQAGISRFVADTLPGNQRMLRLFHEAGFDDQRSFADGVVRVAFPIVDTAAARQVAHQREREAAARSVSRLLAPRSVAVIGAGRSRGNLGRQVLDQLLAGGFNGPVYPVNRSAAHVASIRAYPQVEDIPDPVDLAVVCVPAPDVPAVVEQCARKHVGGLVIMSAGFADAGPDGLAAQRQLVADARGNGMRVIGPNSMGVVNTDPDVALDASPSPMPPPGRIGFIAQSGGLGVAVIDELTRRHLGVSTLVSAGNKADVSGNDLLHYWDGDPATDVICMYIETFGNPRTFGRVARRLSRRKPIVAVKSARSAAGYLAAASANNPAQADEAVDALFRRTGVVRTDTLEQLFDVAQVLAAQPLPAGRRVAIVGTSGGPGVLAADACMAAGLEVARLSPDTADRLRARLGVAAEVRNPVDLAVDAQPPAFADGVRLALADPGVDAAIVCFTAPSAAPRQAVVDAIAAGAAAGTKPVLACLLGRRGLIEPTPTPDGAARRSLPCFAFPEAAAAALGRVARYAEWRRRPEGTVPSLSVDRSAARRVVDTWLAGHPSPDPSPGWLTPDQADELLAAYGIPVAPAAGPDRLVLGLVQDPLFGPLVTLGVDGVRAARAVPLTDLDAEDLLSEVGVGGGESDRIGLAPVLLRLGRLAEEVPEVAEAELRPANATGPAGPNGLAGAPSDGPVGYRARVALRRASPHPELALRRLR